MTEVSARTLAKRRAKEIELRRLDAALLRVMGAGEAILLASDETAACRRASVALMTWDDEGFITTLHNPESVSRALTAWYALRGPEGPQPERWNN